MNGLLNQIMNNMLGGRFKQQMDMYNQMMNGKNPQQQMQTIMNMAKNRNFDVNKKIFSEQDLQALGINIPRKSDFNSSQRQATGDLV